VHLTEHQTSDGGSRGRWYTRFQISALFVGVRLLVVVSLLAPLESFSAPQFDTCTPISFFTNVASRLIATELNLNLFQLQVYPTNQYTPAVHRLLQVTANAYDATTTNQFPSVFRPMFYCDNTGNIFITGYQQLTSVNGLSDPSLAAPLTPTALSLNSSYTGNIYGVPWIIGAKKGFPAFNQFYMRDTVQVTRNLQVTRPDGRIPGATATNQMFSINITNRLGFSFWNSYESNYVSTAPVTVYFSDTLSMSLTNDIGSGSPTVTGSPNPVFTNFSAAYVIPPNAGWPGSAWSTYSGSSAPEQQTPDPNSFVSAITDISFLPESDFQTAMNDFVPFGTGCWDTNSTTVAPFPQFGLMTTNWIQAFILDGSRVIDYVQFSGPNGSRNLAEEIRDKPGDPNYNQNYFAGLLMWVTNGFQNAGTPTLGIVDQIYVSGSNPQGSIDQFWKSPTNMPPGFQGVRAAESAFFSGFFNPSYTYLGKTYVNTSTVVQVPYTPTRTTWEYTSWQANDPLVHYLASDLNTVARYTGIHKADVLATADYPQPNLNALGARYQPWGRNQQMAQLPTYVDSDAYNLRYRDPLVWGSDYWDFPTAQTWNLNWIGRVHRGTPWQTVYLKASDILAEITFIGGNQVSVGINTWEQWTGDTNVQDALMASPAADSVLVSLLGGMLNTNDLRTQFSVNAIDSKAWASLMDGFAVLTNVTDFPWSVTPPVFVSLVISSNSPQLDFLVNGPAGINFTRSNFVNPDGVTGTFEHIGDILRVPALSEQSPFLNFIDAITSGDRLKYDITDEAYEAIPSQLLPLLRMDSIGTMISSNGQMQVQFSGYDGHAYVIQVSPDLKNWSNISTNFPTNGKFSLSVTPTGCLPALFYRSLLQQ
jgi:hypothetical protein